MDLLQALHPLFATSTRCPSCHEIHCVTDDECHEECPPTRPYLYELVHCGAGRCYPHVGKTRRTVLVGGTLGVRFQSLPGLPTIPAILILLSLRSHPYLQDTVSFTVFARTRIEWAVTNHWLQLRLETLYSALPVPPSFYSLFADWKYCSTIAHGISMGRPCYKQGCTSTSDARFARVISHV